MSAAVGCCGALVALSFTQEAQLWQQFITQGVLFGISSSVRVQPALSIVGQYLHRRRALAMGIIAGGSSIRGI